jgi:hypothetical protein
MRYSKCTSNTLYRSVCRWQILVCVSCMYIGVCQHSVCMSGWVCVIVFFLFLYFKLSLGCLYNTHHVNQGGVQKTTPKSLFTSLKLLKSLSGDAEELIPSSLKIKNKLTNIQPEKKRHDGVTHLLSHPHRVYSGKRLKSVSVRSAERV